MKLATTTPPHRPVIEPAAGIPDWRDKPIAIVAGDSAVAPHLTYATMAQVVPLAGATTLAAAMDGARELQSVWGAPRAMAVFQAQDGAFFTSGLGDFSNSSPILFPGDVTGPQITKVTPLVQGLKAIVGGHAQVTFGELTPGAAAPTVEVEHAS